MFNPVEVLAVLHGLLLAPLLLGFRAALAADPLRERVLPVCAVRVLLGPERLYAGSFPH